MFHLHTEPNWHIAHILENHLHITEIILVLILNPGQLSKLFLCTRKSICAGYYCYQLLQFQQIEYDLPNGI